MQQTPKTNRLVSGTKKLGFVALLWSVIPLLVLNCGKTINRRTKFSASGTGRSAATITPGAFFFSSSLTNPEEGATDSTLNGWNQTLEVRPENFPTDGEVSLNPAPAFVFFHDFDE